VDDRSRRRRERKELRAWGHGGTIRHRHKAQPIEFTFGYLHPEGNCPHTPACSAATAKPYGGNDPGSRCKPQPKQQLAHTSLSDIVFYGGAVGGGKSEFAIVEAVMLALQYAGVKVAIFRRTLKELDQELVGRLILLTWAGDRNIKGPNGQPFAKYNSQQHKLTLWNGSEVWLCYCDRESDVYKYQSFQIIGLFLDESSHFTEFMVKYLITRVRSARRGVPKVIRLTSNPGHVGHGWHKRWFIKPTPEELGGRLPPAPFEIWRPRPTSDKIRPDQVATRQFIPAWFHDNLALAAADPDYLASKVYALSGDKAKQLAEGDWDANESMICGSLWQAQQLVTAGMSTLLTQYPHLIPNKTVIPWHVLPNKAWRPAVGANIFGSLDYGFGAPASIHLHASTPGGHTRTFLEFYGARKRDSDQARLLKGMLERELFADGKTPLLEGLQWVVFDPQMDSSRQEHALAKTIIEVFQDINPRVQFLKGAGGRPARLSRPNRWQDALAMAPDGLPWWSCTTACPDLIRTVPEVPWSEKDPDVEDDASENHAYEDTGRFFEARPHAARSETKDPYEELDPLSAAHHRALDQAFDPKDKPDYPQLYTKL
jgi:hypothetical protein